MPIHPSYDVWALGMSIRVLTDGDDLFYTIDRNNMNKNIGQFIIEASANYSRKVDEILTYKWQNLKNNKSSSFLFDLLQKMLKVDPKERIKIKDIKFHPYFLSNIFT